LLFATLPLKLCRCTSLALGSVLVYFIAVIGLSSTTLEELKMQPVDILVGNSNVCLVVDQSDSNRRQVLERI